MASTKTRSYCFTVNNYTDLDIAQVMDLQHTAKYVICGFENDEKTPHIQGYVFFENPVYFNSMKKKLPRAHIEISRGNPQQNYEYCSKDGSFVEYGELPKRGAASWDRICEAMKNPIENFHLYQQYRKTYTEYTRKQPKNHQRELILLPSSQRIEYMRNSTDITFCTSEDTYDNEDVLIIMSRYTIFDIEAWDAGFPPKIRRGYEIIPIDPQKILLLYSDEKEFRYYKKKYSEILDKVIDE